MELLDIYDDNMILTGETVDRAERNSLSAEGDRHLLVVHICIKDTLTGKMLIQRRNLSKKAYPGRWDVSAGGFAKHGESSREAIIRETEEELGLEEIEPEFAFTASFSYVFDDFYTACTDTDPDEIRFQSEEIDELRFAGKTEILDMIKTGEFVDYDTALIEKIFDIFEKTERQKAQ
ncbi:MAG: NUDIX domain-containing protein [Oscillospiraceae bacterium]|nr:NUDIX domain-containing protein [Oscillospiraceae bacterium]